jgi:hypothetical protein
VILVDFEWRAFKNSESEIVCLPLTRCRKAALPPAAASIRTWRCSVLNGGTQHDDWAGRKQLSNPATPPTAHRRRRHQIVTFA